MTCDEHEPVERRADGRKDRNIRRLAGASVVLGFAALAALTLWEGRDFGFHFDEWTVLLEHYDGNYLTPLNGHLIVVPILVYQALLNTVGTGNFHAYLVVGVAVFIAIPGTFYWTHRRLASPILVAFLALILAWSHASVPSLIFPFLINFDIPLLCLLWALHATESDRLRDDGIAAGLVAIALASSGVGVTVAFAVIADVAVRRPRLGRLALFAPPVALWSLWFVFRHAPVFSSTVPAKVTYSWHVVASTFESITRGSPVGGLLVAAGCAVVVVLAIVRWHTFDRRVAVLAATIAVFVASCAWARAGNPFIGKPGAGWYQTVVSLLLVMILVRCLRGVTIPRSLAPVGIALVVVAGVGLANDLNAARHLEMVLAAGERPYIAALEAMGPRADPHRPLPWEPKVTSGEYLAVVDRFGSIAGHVTPATLGTEPSRVGADTWMIADEGVRPKPVDGRRPACRDGWTGMAPGATVPVPPGGALLVTAGPAEPAQISARRFARRFTGRPIGRAAPGSTVSVVVPADRSSTPWNFEVDGAGARAWVCSAS